MFSKIIQVNKTYFFPKNRLHPEVVAYGLLYEIISFISLLQYQGIENVRFALPNLVPNSNSRLGVTQSIDPKIRHQTTHDTEHGRGGGSYLGFQFGKMHSSLVHIKMSLFPSHENMEAVCLSVHYLVTPISED